MSTRATGTFGVKTWDEKPYEDREGAWQTRIRASKTLHGAVEGDGHSFKLDYDFERQSDEGQARPVGSLR